METRSGKKTVSNRMDIGSNHKASMSNETVADIPVHDNSYSPLTDHGDRSSQSSDASPTQGNQSPGQSPTSPTMPTGSGIMTQDDFQSCVMSSLKMLIDGQKDMKSELESFKKEINQTIESQMEQIEELKSANEELKTENNSQWDHINQTRNYVSRLFNEVNKVERYTRKNNLRIVGLAETEGENVKIMVREMFFTKFSLEDIEIERAHRDGKIYKDRNGTPRPRHIIVKLLRYTDKVKIMKMWRTCLKDESFRVTDDLTKSDLEEKKRWQPEVKALYNKGEKLRFVNGMWRDNKGKRASFYTANPYFQLEPAEANTPIDFSAYQ